MHPPLLIVRKTPEYGRGLRPNGARDIRIYPRRTAIVARVRGGGMFELYEQNVATAGANARRRGQLRKRDVNFRGVLEGSIRAYRPEAKIAAAE
ncbi:MAG: hypothetical protein M3552_07945 [Planctomycetota bacterium]|nr:hypothetical protein [Planctomycetaceae bacterium]MDQ3330570.1 hypothetical protein [Planctomycetota bacterium]